MFSSFIILSLGFVLLILDHVRSADHEWCYHDEECAPETWPDVCKIGLAQSPINLVPSNSNRGKLETWNIRFSRDYCSDHKGFVIQNNDHTLEVRLNNDGPSMSHVMSGQGFSGEYVFAQLHFHWGTNDRVGSEHTVNDKRFVMEMHLVHAKLDRNGKIVKAGTGDDSIAVLGVFFELDPKNDKDHPGLAPIVEAIRANKMRMPDPSVSTWVNSSTINLLDLIPSKREIFRYCGSLTTPTCAETVLWTVFREPVCISKRQLNVFRALKTSKDEPIGSNFRPTQELNGRRVIQKIFAPQTRPDWKPNKKTNINIKIRF